MSGYFEYDTYQKGYKPFILNKENVLANKDKWIVYLLKCDYDGYRGYMFPRHSTLHDMRYSQVIIDNGNDSFDKRDVLDIGIEVGE